MVINLVNLNITGACFGALHGATAFHRLWRKHALAVRLLANAENERALPSLSGAEMGMGEPGSSAPSSSSSSSSTSQYGSCRSRLVSCDLLLNPIIDFYCSSKAFVSGRVAKHLPATPKVVGWIPDLAPLWFSFLS